MSYRDFTLETAEREQKENEMRSSWFSIMLLAIVVAAGCGQPPAKPPAGANAPPAQRDPEAKIADALAKLSADDRAAAEAQRFCAVENENRLGLMGPPAKIMIKGQAVFLCCAGCESEAEADPDATLAKVAELKEATPHAEQP
jgi:hypothetical protein